MDNKWEMPSWMEKYRRRICNTGGNSIEELMNDMDSNMVTNPIRASLAIAVKSQVLLLTGLHDDELLE